MQVCKCVNLRKASSDSLLPDMTTVWAQPELDQNQLVISGSLTKNRKIVRKQVRRVGIPNPSKLQLTIVFFCSLN